MIIGSIKRQWIWCIMCHRWLRSDYYTVKGQANRICEKCMPDSEQPEPRVMLRSEVGLKGNESSRDWEVQ